MSSGCSSGGCSGCSSASSCGVSEEFESLLVEQNQFSDIKKVIGVISGKGGVGKSLITSMLATGMMKRGKEVGILDADITGPSIPKSFGIDTKAQIDDRGIIPCKTENGIKIMSINLLLEKETDPVIWRGPVIGGVIKAILDRCCLGKCRLYVCGYAAGNRRCCFNSISITTS